MTKQLVCSRDVEEQVMDQWHPVKFPERMHLITGIGNYLNSHCTQQWFIKKWITTVWFQSLEDCLHIQQVLAECDTQHFVAFDRQNFRDKDAKKEREMWLTTHVGLDLRTNWPKGKWIQGHKDYKPGHWFSSLEDATQFSLVWN